MKPKAAISIVAIASFGILLVVTIAGALTGFMPKETVGLIFFGLIGTCLISAIVYERAKKRRLLKWLRSRPQLNDNDFAKTLFPDDAERGAIAARVRRVLAANLKLPLDGLQPQDRLDADLQTELAANPDLFWELEAEFGIKTEVEEYEAHEASLKHLVTFADLVGYISVLVRERPPPTACEPPPPADFPARIFRGAIRCIPILCLTGFVVIIAGILAQRSFMMKLGTGLFLAGFAVWGLANGGGFAWGLLLAVREQGFKELRAHPWAMLLLTLLATFFLAVGGFFIWAVAKALMSSN